MVVVAVFGVGVEIEIISNVFDRGRGRVQICTLGRRCNRCVYKRLQMYHACFVSVALHVSRAWIHMMPTARKHA